MRFHFLNFRTALALLFFALSLMVVIPAPKIPLWYLVILATEYGHWLMLVPLGLIIWEVTFHFRQSHFFLLFFCVVATALFLKPLAQATHRAGSLAADLGGFGPLDRPQQLPARPLRWIDLWTGVKIPPVKEENLIFTTRDGTSLNLRYYRDETPGARPCVIMIHGGGWNSGDERQLGAWNRRLAGEGYRVAAVAYRLAPQFHWPAQKEDIVAALDFLKSHAGALGIDPGRFVLQGRSAGGQIALTVAYSLHDPSIRGCIGAYAPTDMKYAYETSSENDILHSRPLLRSFLGGPPESLPALYRDASPMTWVDAASPPTLLIHGTRDELVSVQHSKRLGDLLTAQGRPFFFLELPWATHGFDVNPSGPGGQLEFYTLLWFLQVVTRPEGGPI